MHSNTAATAIMLFAAAASAFALPQNNAGTNTGSNMCDVSTFNNGATYGYPQAPVENCTALIDNIDPSETWSVAHSWSRLYTVGSCAFSVRVIAGFNNGLIGGSDVKDLINDSINQFQEPEISCTGQYEQYVAGEGEVDCNTYQTNNQTDKVVRVEWLLASSAYNPANN